MGQPPSQIPWARRCSHIAVVHRGVAASRLEKGGAPLAIKDAARHEGKKWVLANHFGAAAFEK